jgi:hypothetical protein
MKKKKKLNPYNLILKHISLESMAIDFQFVLSKDIDSQVELPN